MMRVIKSIIIVGFIITQVTGCTSPEPEHSQVQDNMQEQPIATQQEQLVANEMMTATVRYINLEGGFYGLITSSGEKLLATNLAKKFHQDGTILQFRSKPVKDRESIQQWGTMIELLDVKLVKQGIASDL